MIILAKEKIELGMNQSITLVKAKYNFSQYHRFRSLGKKRDIHNNGKFSPINSEEFYYIDNTCGQYDIWKQKLPGSYPLQLTFSEEWIISSFIISNDGASIFFNAHFQGNEKMQIFTLPTTGGPPRRISKNLEMHYLISPNCQLDETHLIVTSNQFGPTNDVAILDIETGELDYLTASDRNLVMEAISPDGNYLVISEFVRHSKSNLYLMSLDKKELEMITTFTGDGHNFFACWTADSKGFYLLSNTEREFMAGKYYNILKKSSELIIDSDWDVGKVCTSADGKWLVWSANENGYDILYLKELASNSNNISVLKSEGKIDIQEFSKDSKFLAYAYGDCTKQSDVHIFDLRTQTEYTITKNMLGGIDPQDMVKPDLVKITGTTGLEFSGFLFKPKIELNQKVPVMLFIHGGPDSQERATYDSLKQILLSIGIGVLAPNIRGSTGYGQTFQKLIHRKFIDIQGDIEGCANYIKSLDWVDANRIGIVGGSFGGFAALFAITKIAYMDWTVAVDFSGPSNLITFTKNVPEYWKPLIKAWIGDPFEDEVMLKEASPINFVDQVCCENILIGQGAKDPRVPKTESDQIVEELRNMGKNVEYLVFENEGHSLSKHSNFLDFNKKAIEFIYKSFFNLEIDL